MPRLMDTEEYGFDAYRRVEFLVYTLLLLGWNPGRMGMSEVHLVSDEWGMHAPRGIRLKMITQGIQRNPHTLQVMIQIGNMQPDYVDIVNISPETWKWLLNGIVGLYHGRSRVVERWLIE